MQLSSDLRLEQSRAQHEQRELFEKARLSSFVLSDGSLLAIQALVLSDKFKGRALQERWHALCAPPRFDIAAEIEALDRIDVSPWLQGERTVDIEWQRLVAKDRDRFKGSVIEVHLDDSVEYYMFIYATKKPLVPFWMRLTKVEVALPTLEFCESDSFEQCLAAWAQTFRAQHLAIYPGYVCTWPEEIVDMAQEFHWADDLYVSDDHFVPISIHLPEAQSRRQVAAVESRAEPAPALPEEVLAQFPWLARFGKHRHHHRHQTRSGPSRKRARVASSDSEGADEQDRAGSGPPVLHLKLSTRHVQHPPKTRAPPQERRLTQKKKAPLCLSLAGAGLACRAGGAAGQDHRGALFSGIL